MRKSFELVKSLYRTYDGKPFEMKEGQCDIFEEIFKKSHPRVHVMTYTRYGKSDIISMAVLTRASTFPEKWAIIGPSEKKAKIIIGYAIQHIFDNPYTLQKFRIGADESLERIKRERSKNRLTFKIGKDRIGEIFIQSAEAHRQIEVEKALMGFGAPNIVEDESALIPDPIHSTVMRMLGDQPDSFLVKVGNPFTRGHFLRSFRDPRYYKITIDYEQGVREGRITQDFIEEMKKEAMFGILYECKFPEQTAIDSKGYSPILTEADLDRAYLEDVQLFGELRIGCDVAGGGRNFSTIVLRGANGAKILYRENNPDTMSFVGIILRFTTEHKIKPANIFVDSIGLGKGVVDRLNEQLTNISGISFGEAPEYADPSFLNLRAQSFWRMGDWIKGGAKLKRDDAWEELLDIKYKVQSDRKIKIKGKEEMQREGILSPDIADALALTFAKERSTAEKIYKQPPYRPISDFEGR